MGTVYLIHFSQPHRHARHYLGYADDLERRIRHHRDGSGARLMQVVTQAGISWDVVRTWDGDRSVEKQLKRWHSGADLCPVCQQARIAQRLSNGKQV